MKRKRVIIIFFGVLFLFLMINYYLIKEAGFDKQIRLGYCPTMYSEALFFSEKSDYELVEFNSASEVLFALKNKRIDKALIGRKAELKEISENINEIILKSGYTLVSNQKGFIGVYELSQIEVYSSLSSDVVSSLMPFDSKITYYDDKEEIYGKISEGRVALISWDDWRDDYELIVVMSGNEKAKEFRGIFLYEN